MQLYSKDGLYDHANEMFMTEIVAKYPALKFFQPSPKKAPWHVQCFVDSREGREGELNFWPHVQKVSYGGPAEIGIEAMHEKIAEAMNDMVSRDNGDFDLIEG
jgi:hypothetical protein